MDSPLQYRLDENGVGTITLNRPEKHNAFDDQLIFELNELVQNIANDDNVRVVILAGAGKSFSSGADLGWMKRMASYTHDENVQDATGLANLLFNLNHLPKPTIAKVQGAAFGGAIGLISCCDMAVATKLTKFCFSEVKLGLVPATISPYVISAMGSRVARRYFLTGEVFSARRARRLGLISESVAEEDLDTTVDQLATALLRNGPHALEQAKQLIFDVSDHPIDSDVIDLTSELIAKVRGSHEGQEGLSAFLEKRKPNWIKE